MARRWLSLAVATWLQSINGTNSNFPAYSSQLKRLLSMSQCQLNNLAFASDAGKLFGWLSGIASVHLPLWLVLLIGSLLGFVGYGVQYLYLTDHISSLSYWHVILLTALAGNSVSWINTVCYVVTIHNFPFERQVAVGLSTSYVGLSAKIYGDIVDVMFSSSPTERAKAYLLLNAVVPLMVCVVAAPMVRDVNGRESRRIERGFVLMFVITISTGIYAVISSLHSISSGMSPLVIVIGMGAFLLAPLVIPLADLGMERLQKKCRLRRDGRVHGHNVEEVDLERRDGGSGLTTEGGGGEGNVPEIEEVVSDAKEIGVKLMLRTVDFWLYFFVYLFGPTLGLVFLNNLGQIAESRGCSRTSTLVSLSSSFGFLGRLIPSLLDYYFSGSKLMGSGPLSIAGMMAPISGTFFLLLNGTNLSLYISTSIIGTCTGAITSIAVSTTAELFGVKNFSVNHNIVVGNIPIGSFLFGNLAAFLYGKQSNGKDGGCMGVGCYQTTFIIWGSLCFLGTLLALVLHARTKKFYSQRSS